MRHSNIHMCAGSDDPRTTVATKGKPMGEWDGLTTEDVRAIADAVSEQMLSLPRELAAFIEPNRTQWIALDVCTRNGGADNVALKIMTDTDGMWLEFSAQGNQRLALLRFNYRGWAWHRFDTPNCPLCGQDHRR